MYSLYKYLGNQWIKLKADRQFRNNSLKTILVSILFFWLLFYLGSEAKESDFLTQIKVK